MELATPGASWAFAVPFCNHADSHPSGPAPDPQVPCCIFPLVTGPTGDAPGEGRARLWTAPGTPVGAPPQGRWHGGSEALTSQRQCWQGCEHGQVHGTCDLLGTNHRKECARSCGPALLGTHPPQCFPSPHCLPQVSPGPCYPRISPLGLLEAVCHASRRQPVLLKAICPPVHWTPQEGFCARDSDLSSCPTLSPRGPAPGARSRALLSRPSSLLRGGQGQTGVEPSISLSGWTRGTPPPDLAGLPDRLGQGSCPQPWGRRADQGRDCRVLRTRPGLSPARSRGCSVHVPG